VTWYVLQGFVKHLEIIELDKPPELDLGRKLRRKNQEYEDIEEILARFFTPFNDFINEVITHRKYIEGDKKKYDSKNESTTRSKS
jgi:hypothetical protein